MHFTRSRRRALFLAIIALVGAVLIGTLSPDTPTGRSHVARGVLSVPTNMLTALSPSVCTSTNLLLATGAVVDSTMTHGDASSCGSVKLPTATSCPISGDPLTTAQTGIATSFVYPNGPIKGECFVGGSLVRTYQVPVSGNTRYTFSAYMKSAGTYPGDVYVNIEAFNSSGTAIGNVLVDSWANSKTSDGADKTVGWEESLGWFQTQSTAATIYIQLTRYMASTPPIDNVWIDDFYLGTGFVHREEDPAITKTFPGTTTALDALGNFTVKRINGPTAGQMESFFPKCISVRTSVHTLQWYADRGWNCIWGANLNDSLSTAPWTSTTNLLVGGRAAVSSSVPDGMRVLMDVDEAVRGSFAFEYTRSDTGAVCLSTDPPPCTAHSAHLWNGGIKDNMVNAMGTIVTRGYADTLLGILNDAEDKTSRRQRDRAVMELVDSTDRANNGGQRRWPIVTNAGNPSISRSYTKADGSSYIDLTGTYSARTGPFEKMRHEQGQQAPVGYCQLQTGGLNLRQMLYRCLAEGGKMFALWSDSSNTNLALGSQVGVNLEYEPSYNDFPFMWAEVDKLMPLIRQPLPTDWSVTSSNTAVDVWPRSYNGVPYLFVSNTSGAAQTTTFSFAGVSGTPTTLVDYGWAAGTPDSGTTVKSSSMTITVPAAGNATSVGVGGGTLVLRVTGATVSNTTIPGGTTTTVAPATTTTTTTPPTSPSSHIDDTSFTCSPIASGTSDESSGWKQYGPGFGIDYDPADYASSNRVTRLAGATCTVSFTGTAATLYGATGPYDGRFTVTLDGAPAGTGGCATVAGGKCETYAATSTRHVPVWSVSGLTVGTHTIVVTVDGTVYAPSASAYVVMDELEVSSAADHLYAATLPTPPSIGSGAANVAANRINVNCNGTLTGVWWWRAATDTGTITVALWNTSGTLLASGSGDPAAGPGWRYLPFTTAADVVPGTTIIAGVLHPTGAYSYAYNGFTGRSVTSPTGCLTSPASTGGALNGTYAYSSTLTFPTSSYLDSEYFVSPSFTPSIPTGPVIFRDDFTTLDPSKNTVDGFGVRNYVRTWRQNDYWQNAEKGYVDFTGNRGNWNANKWETLNVAGGGTTTLNPFSVSGGVLSITNAALPSNLQADVVAKANAQGQSPAVAPARYGGFLVTDRDWINPTTGLANTFKGGYYELRARFPDANGTNGKGLFPAWWLFASDEATNSENKGAAEIDIFEMFGFPAHSPITRTLHFGNNTPGSVTYSPHELGSSTLDMSQWHTYALNWLLATDTGGPRLDFYLDGALVNTVSGTEAAWFTTPMSMRINFAADADFIIGAGRGTDGTTASSARFDVDYVEVRAPLGATSPTTTTTSPSTTTTTSAGTTTTTSTSTTTTTTTTPPTTTTLAPQPCIVGGAYNATASTSSSPATAYALTDQTSAGWTAASTTNQTITLDLGSDQTLGSIAFGWRARRAASSWVVDVRTSRSSRWTRVSTASGYRTNGRDQCLLRRLSARGRYVRVTTIGTEANLPVRLSELAVYP